MAKITKMVAGKRLVTRTIVSSMLANHQVLGAELEKTLFDGQPPVALTMADVVHAIGMKLEKDYQILELRDREVATEVAQDSVKRTRRDAIVTRLRQRLISLRSMIDSDFGTAAVAHLGMSGPTPDAPDLLITHSQNVLMRLEDDFDDFQPLLQELGRPDFTIRADAIKKEVAGLTIALAALDQDLRETQDSQNVRNRATEAWSKSYSPVASIIENLYRLADMPAHAERVRPTHRRRAGVPEPEDLENAPPQDDVREDDEEEEVLMDV